MSLDLMEPDSIALRGARLWACVYTCTAMLLLSSVTLSVYVHLIFEFGQNTSASMPSFFVKLSVYKARSFIGCSSPDQVEYTRYCGVFEIEKS